MNQLMIIVTAILCIGSPLWAACPSADLTRDCKVTLEDFAIMASQWLTEGTPTPIPPSTTWISISDPGVPGHEGFTGEMSKYETTNVNFAQYLNAALASGNITVGTYNHPWFGNIYSVKGATGTYAGEIYYRLDGPGWTGNGAEDGGKSRIIYNDGIFTVESDFENHPVTYVSWYGATAFAEYYSWRLPTEWEWQAVADYDGSYLYGCGTTINNSIANYRDSTHPHGTTPVGQLGTYGYCMADMAGNAWEWTSSLWSSTSSFRVLRGGSWWRNDNYCSVSYRYTRSPNTVSYHIGFRVCR